MWSPACRAWYLPWCVNSARPFTSPTAYSQPPSTPSTCRWSFTFTYRCASTPTASSPTPSTTPVRPAATSSSCAYSISPLSIVTLTPSLVRFAAATTHPNRNTTPCASSDSTTARSANGSNRGVSSGVLRSSTVTSAVPSDFHACAISSPTTPPPMTMRLSGTLFADVISRLVHGSASASPSMGGMNASEPVASTTAFRASSSTLPLPSANSTTTRFSPSSRPQPRRSVAPTESTHWACPSSLQWLANASRARSARAASTAPVTASRAAGTRRAAASASPGRSSALLGIHAQYEHSPPTSSDSTMAVLSPAGAVRPAMFSPADPPPMMMTS